MRFARRMHRCTKSNSTIEHNAKYRQYPYHQRLHRGALIMRTNYINVATYIKFAHATNTPQVTRALCQECGKWVRAAAWDGHAVTHAAKDQSTQPEAPVTAAAPEYDSDQCPF